MVYLFFALWFRLDSSQFYLNSEKSSRSIWAMNLPWQWIGFLFHRMQRLSQAVSRRVSNTKKLWYIYILYPQRTMRLAVFTVSPRIENLLQGVVKRIPFQKVWARQRLRCIIWGQVSILDARCYLLVIILKRGTYDLMRWHSCRKASLRISLLLFLKQAFFC